MTNKTHVHVPDLVGLNRLATDVTAWVTDLAEVLHNNVASSPGIFGTPMQERSSAIAAQVYESVRCVTRFTGGTTDTILAQLVPPSWIRAVRLNVKPCWQLSTGSWVTTWPQPATRSRFLCDCDARANL